VGLENKSGVRPCRDALKQTNKQTNKQPNKQTNKHLVKEGDFLLMGKNISWNILRPTTSILAAFGLCDNIGPKCNTV
jgi:hypothetical protein